MRTSRERIVPAFGWLYIIGAVALVLMVPTKSKGFFFTVGFFSIVMGVVLQINAPQ